MARGRGRLLGADAMLADDLAQEAFVIALRRENFDERAVRDLLGDHVAVEMITTR